MVTMTIPDVSGPLSCDSFNWSVETSKEPFHFNDSTNQSAWVQYSPPVFIDFSDSRVLSVMFGECSLDGGILVMIKPDELITVTGGATASAAVSLALPRNAIVFANTTGTFCSASNGLRNATAQKTITETGTSNSIVIPAGTLANNGHGDYRLFSFATYGTGDSVTPTTSASNFYLRTFDNGVPKTVLSTRGFLTTNDVFKAKFCLISCGISHCFLKDVSCSADCEV
jgi:hypothetical protein